MLVYSGSAAGWQSFQLLNQWFEEILLNNSKVKILFLSKKQAVEKLSIYTEFHDRIVVDWLKPEDVYSVLNACDYGVLYREDSITNRVASPTKFPEYLACNLKVVASPGIGDVSDCIIKNDCGILIDTLSVDEGVKNLQNLVFNFLENKNTNNKIPLENYLWQNYSQTYKEIYN